MSAKEISSTLQAIVTASGGEIFVGGVPVTLRVRGQKLKGIGEAITSERDVVKHLQDYLRKVPKHAKYFNVTLDPDGNPNLADVARAAQDRVGVRIQLETTS